MKYFVSLLFVFIIFTSCNTEEPCFGKSGKTVIQTIALNPFDAIDIPKGFTVEIIEANESKIEVYSYENYFPNLDFKVSNNQLIMTNSMSCSLLHSYEIAKIKVYTPTLKQIHSRTQLKVSSLGTLHFPELVVKSGIDGDASSTFELKIDNEVLKIEDNLVGFFKVSGKTNWLDISLFGGNGRVEANLLECNDCTFFHRSNNDIFIHVNNKLSGTIYATGNVILLNKPKEVEVVEKYKGKLIYN